jgi:hydrogenase nickel incorporation protein HypA/HybF
LHELSIAQALVELAVESAEEGDAVKVTRVNVRLGKLAGVVKSSLDFCYDFATENTILEGSQLNVIELPVIVYCAQCDDEVELEDIQAFFCPICQTRCPEIRQGKEMELESIEIEL